MFAINHSDHRLLLGSLICAALAGCSSMDMGSQAAKTTATGSAGGANAENANAQLERCPATMGTLAIVEDTHASWYGYLTGQLRLGSTVPVLKLLVQQSNCFVIVEPVSYTHLRAHETVLDLVCRLLLGKKKHKHTHLNIRH